MPSYDDITVDDILIDKHAQRVAAAAAEAAAAEAAANADQEEVPVSLPPTSYCHDLVQENDKDRYLLSMSVPEARREALWTLFAFNHEIAKTREVVSEQTMGLIRLQWWRDAIAQIYETGNGPEHEIVNALAVIIDKFNLSQEHFDRILYAREFDLMNLPPGNIGGFFHYADYTNTPLLRMVMQIMGEQYDVEYLSSLGKIYGGLGLLRSVPYFLQQGHIFLPAEMLRDQNLNLDNIGQIDSAPRLASIVREICVFMDMLPEPDELPPHFMQTLIIVNKSYMKLIKRLKYNVFHPRLARPPTLLPLRIMLNI